MTNAIITWRYLRLAIVALVVGLFAAVIWEWHLAPGYCLQESISAYFYTPARGVFTGALIGIGVCLFSIRGSTELEESFLNLAGIFAPMVALIPTPRLDDRRVNQCASYPGTSGGRVEGYTNAMVAVFVIGALTLLLLAALVVVGRLRTGAWGVSRSAVVGWCAGWAFWGSLLALFALARDWFDENMHFWSAGLMFFCAWVVVLLNTFDSKARQLPWVPLRAVYLSVAIAMPAVAGAILIARYGLEWKDHWVFWLEVGEVVPFTAFWVVQSVHLWNKTARP